MREWASLLALCCAVARSAVCAALGAQGCVAEPCGGIEADAGAGEAALWQEKSLAAQGCMAEACASIDADDDVAKVTLLQVQSRIHANVSWLRTEFYFGLSWTAANGTTVDIPLDSFRQFLAETITPAFPDGLTWSVAHGQYMLKSGEEVLENSVSLIVYHHEDAATSAKVEEVASAYADSFRQESVMVVDDKLGVRFVEGRQNAREDPSRVEEHARTS
uniref:Uncharacterized protein n=1 Tax=Alexandrium catenella TaxID=2925 RepID=A0A7S1WXN7_ALECA